jgi:Ser/Thr protein kinase RdoA (MazF antagonist)
MYHEVTSKLSKHVDKDLIASTYTDAAWEAVQHFPVQAEDIKLVAYSENVTFRVANRDSETDFVLRLHRPGYSSLDELESERVWTRALRETGVAVPDSLKTHDGGHYALVDIPDAGEQRYAGMTTWSEGTPLSDHLQSHPDGAERLRIFRRFGEIAATFHNQSAGWKPPPGFVRRRLGVEELLGDTPFWGRFWEHPALTEAEKACLVQTRDSLRSVLSEYGESPDHFSLIHADFTPDNIIYDGDDLAIIDFDDAAYGWHAYDLASVLIECRHARDLDALRDALLDGYLEHRPLAKREIEMLPVFLLIRGMAVIGWYHQRPEHAHFGDFEDLKNWVLEAADCRRP